MGEWNESGRRFSIVIIVIFIIVLGEISSVYRWEKTFYGKEPAAYKTSNVLLTAEDYRAPVYDVNITLLISGITSFTTSEEITKVSPTIATAITWDYIPEGYTDSLVTSASNKAKFHRLPSGGIRLSRELQQELKQRLKTATDKKVILVWIPMFGVKAVVTINTTNCGNCEVSYDRGKINDENVRAVVFHFDALNAENMPPQRNPKQLYIYWDEESTATLKVVRGHSLKFEDAFKFNATMTYRRDSDFYHSYENVDTVEDIVEKNTLSQEELLKLKSKMAVAVVSNCGYTPGARTRMKMLRELISFNFGLEGYGGCFKGPKFAGGARGHESQFISQVRKYKFYLSFENSYHCKDYITEKFFNNALRSLAVPVVWGAKKKDYEFVAPPGSFIFVEDFSSLKKLSEYLKYLDRNDTAYLEYFRWLTKKPSDMPQYGRSRNWCDICRALHGINVDDIYNPKFDENNMKRPLFTDGIANRTVDHLIQWYYGEDNPECFNR